MPKKVLQIKGYTHEKIREYFDSEPKYKIGMRLYAIYQVSIGQPSRKLETLYNTSFKQICNWVHRFEEEGIEGLQDKPKSGRPSKLTKKQLSTIKELLLSSPPTEFGYNTSTWNGPILIDYVQKEYGILYKKAQIYNILKVLGFTFQKGRPSYPESDPEKQEIFKEELKKTSK